MILVLLADGFEEIEALTPVDMLRRAGLTVKTVGIASKIAVGSHGISVLTDLSPDEVKLDEVTMAIFPGGMPGSLGLDASPFTDKVIEAVNKNGGRLAAICAAPLVLGHRGLLDGKRATCYPGFEKELSGAETVTDAVVTDGNITTSRGMGTALAFAEELVALACGEEKARELSLGVMSEHPYEIKPKAAEILEPRETVSDGVPTDDEILAELNRDAEMILNTCECFGLLCEIKEVVRGHRVTRYTLKPLNGKMSKFKGIIDDISLSLAKRVRMSTAPGKSTVDLEVQNTKSESVLLSDLTKSYEFTNAPKATTCVLGQNVAREPVFADITRMPHMLIGGAGGSGKSSLLHTVIVSLMEKCTPDELKFVLIDPKGTEFGCYADMPHLYSPIITDTELAVAALGDAASLMDERYAMLTISGARNIAEYNEKTNGRKMEYLAVIVDELLPLMREKGDEVEASIVRIAQKARAVGIHLFLSTATVNKSVITGMMKSVIPTKIAFFTGRENDSLLLLDDDGATRLLGEGDMLYSHAAAMGATRIQAAYVSPAEIADAVASAKEKYGRS